MSAGTGRRRVVITGAGVLSPLGESPERLHAALAAGERGLVPLASFAAGELPCRAAGELNGFAPESYLEGNLRPLDRPSRLAAAAAALALEASGWDRPARAQVPVGLVLGTMFGSIRTISEFDRRALTAGPAYVKPFDFANSVINAAAGQAAIWHGLTGVNATVAGGATAGLGALAYAADLVAAGRAPATLAGGAEELAFESFFGLCRLGLTLGSNGRSDRVAVPFHARRGGFVPAEGAALLMLEEEGIARGRGAAVLGEVLGWGSGFDASRGREADAGAAAMARAVRLALADAGIEPRRLACWSASASGGVTLDRVEATGVAAALGDAVVDLPVTAVKGQLGEALGASGALQAVVALESLRRGLLPGIAGLDEPEPDLPVAAGPASRPVPAGPALVTSLGLDGNASALVLAAVPAEGGR